MIVHDLSNAAWSLRPVGGMEFVPRSVRAAVCPARVPGCVHTDLMRAGLIGDPRVGFNEEELQWIGETDWEYRGVFRVESEMLGHERIDLVCEGLDTIAEVSVNGKAVGAAANMFHPHRFDLRGVLHQSGGSGADNEIVIVFRSPLKHIRAERGRWGALPHNGDGLKWAPYPYIRKTACNFGWDWGPRVATCGVSGEVRIEAWSGVRIAGVRTLTRRVGKSPDWCLDVHVQLDWAGQRDERRTVVLGGGLTGDDGADTGDSRSIEMGETGTSLRIPVKSPVLWSPRNGMTRGDQVFYNLDLALFGGPHQDTVLDTQLIEVYFREVCLNNDADEHGSKFQLEVNGEPVFCKGANWIPEGLFPDDRSSEKIWERVRQAAAANMNMLRVWGGGNYECDAFYEECDRLGIMVWQDFMFACACYPEHAEFAKSVETEARHQIARLSTHPSVVLWCGGNECVWGRECWGHAVTDTLGPWKERTKDRPWGAGYWFDLLPRLLRELDPTRPYWPNSPASSAALPGDAVPAPNDSDHGNRHTWDAPPGSEAFRAIVSRFCSEFGQQSPPNLETLARVVAPEDLVVGSAAMHHRQRGTGGMGAHLDPRLAEWLAAHPEARSGAGGAEEFAAWVRNSQRAQADALAAAIEWLAANRPRCMGALVWQLNDAWPGMSWSLIDSEGRPKAAYGAVKAAFGKISP